MRQKIPIASLDWFSVQLLKADKSWSFGGDKHASPPKTKRKRKNKK